MSNNDLHNNIKPMMAVVPVALGTTGAISGAILDRQGYGGVEFLVEYGSITTTGTNVALTMLEGDATGAMTSVADADMLGTELLASLVADSDRTAGVGKEVTKRVGYIGSKRYVQISLNHTGTTSAGVVAASAVLFNPSLGAVSNP